jgi:hypothetical protein
MGQKSKNKFENHGLFEAIIGGSQSARGVVVRPVGANETRSLFIFNNQGRLDVQTIDLLHCSPREIVSRDEQHATHVDLAIADHSSLLRLGEQARHALEAAGIRHSHPMVA